MPLPRSEAWLYAEYASTPMRWRAGSCLMDWSRLAPASNPVAATAASVSQNATCIISPGRELGEVVDAELLLDGRDLLDALLAEQLVLLLLELLAEFLEALRRDDLVQGRKQHGVLAGLVRAVHANERLARADDLPAGVLLSELVAHGVAQDHVRHLPAC